jgi:CBS domain-containing protein
MCAEYMEAQHYVQEVMTTPVVAVPPDISANEAARALARRRIGAAPVVGRSLQVLGIVTEADLLGVVGPANRTAREAMTSPAVTVTAGTTVAEAQAVLRGLCIGRLPVVDGDGVLIGIVSRRDLLGSLLPTDADLERRVVDRVAGAGGEVDAVTVSGGSVWIRGRVASRGEIAVLEQGLRETPGVVYLELDFACDDDIVAAEAGPGAQPTPTGMR